METMNSFAKRISLAGLAAAALTISARGQLPIPAPGQRPARDGSRGGVPGRLGSGDSSGRDGRGGPATPAEAVKQVATPIPAARQVTGPGEFYETFMDDHDDETNANIPAQDIYAKFNYEAKEYFISGQTSNGVPYQTRIVIRKPTRQYKIQWLNTRGVDAPER